MILGRDVLEALGIIVDFKAMTMRWDEIEIAMKNNSQAIMSTESLPDINAALPNTLTVSQRLLASKLLTEYGDLLNGLGMMNGDAYHIPMKPNSTPVHSRPYPVPQVHLQSVKNEIQRLLDLDVIKRDTSSSWAAPAFPILKKNGTIRLVMIDYRRLNQAVVRHPFPLPKISTILQSLQPFVCVSTLDGNMGYHQIPIANSSQSQLAFVLPFVKYTFKRLPFGLSTAPDEYQARMNTLLGDLSYVHVYLDDILVITTTSIEDHVEQLSTVFERIRGANLTLNFAKCRFFAKSTEYLGFTITCDGNQPIESKAVHWSGELFPRRAHVMQPLTAMTSKQAKFSWTAQCEQAFRGTQKLLSETTLLHYPNFNEPFTIHTDSSSFQLGGVISQNGKPLAFFSGKLSTSQRNYTVTEQEMLSIVELLKEYRNILLGRKIVIYTDHKNLSFTKFTNPRVHRWRLIVEEFGPTIKYTRGTTNVAADALSRLNIQNTEDTVMANDDDFPLKLSIVRDQQKTAGITGMTSNVEGIDIVVDKHGRVVVPDAL
ncbi:hypothetical protein AeRB84_021591 [Aphanomyces euteiches]|nr:hypothetical protein AeRB84_021591 [Aphanomyces euteiches]